MSSKLCKLLLDVDDLFTDGTVDVNKFNKLDSYKKYCPYENGKPGECKDNYERINALGEYLYQKLPKDSNEFKGIGNNDNLHIEFFMMWLGDKIFKIGKDYKSTLKESYEKHLKNITGNFEYWEALNSKKVYKNATIVRMYIFYNLLNSICKTINELEKNLNNTDAENLKKYGTQCLDLYRNIYDSVKECKSYTHLLDSLKTIYEYVKSYKITDNKNIEGRKKVLLFDATPSLTTSDYQNKYFIPNDETLSFSNQECGKVKSKDEKDGKKGSLPDLQSIQGDKLPKKRNIGNQIKTPLSADILKKLKANKQQLKAQKKPRQPPAPPAHKADRKSPHLLPQAPADPPQQGQQPSASSGASTPSPGTTPSGTTSSTDTDNGVRGIQSNTKTVVNNPKDSKGGISSHQTNQDTKQVNQSGDSGVKSGVADGGQGSKVGDTGSMQGDQGKLSGGSGRGTGIGQSSQVGDSVSGAGGGAVGGSASVQNDQGISGGGAGSGTDDQGTTGNQGVSSNQGGNTGGRTGDSGDGAGNGINTGAGGAGSITGDQKAGSNGNAGDAGTNQGNSGSGTVAGSDGDQGTQNPASVNPNNLPGSSDGEPKVSGDQTPKYSSGASYGYWISNWRTNLNPMSYMPSISDMYQAQTNIITKATNQISNAYNSAMTIAKDTYNSTVTAVKNTYDSTMTAVKNTYDSTMTAVKGAYDATNKYIGGAVSSITNQLNSFSTFSQLGDGQSGPDGTGSGSSTGSNPSNTPQIPNSDPNLDPNSPPLPSPSSTPAVTTPSPSPTSPDTKQTISQPQSGTTQGSSQITDQNGGPDPVQSHDTNPGTGIPKTQTNSSTDPSTQGNGSTTGTVVKMNEKPSIWCIGPNMKCDLVGISVIGVSISIFLAITYKYLSFGSAKNSKKKKKMKRVINSTSGKKQIQIVIKSHSQKKQIKKSIKPIYREKSSLLNIYKIIQADPMPFINLFFLLIFFVYKRKKETIE
ncbi:CIR protein [Plasmodium chabaudi adami]|uniref:CIR protein n=1 Tax=Plasmodium chabaudi adami TaxID=5826 RepID=A0A1C6WXM7_PLACE|nr:CIR protein [Plasmodium chabaudi adami]